jgi:hypothetical protein
MSDSNVGIKDDSESGQGDGNPIPGPLTGNFLDQEYMGSNGQIEYSDLPTFPVSLLSNEFYNTWLPQTHCERIANLPLCGDTIFFVGRNDIEPSGNCYYGAGK